jgi:hypothetical protein
LVLPQARIRKVKIDLGAEAHKISLEFQTALTQEVAESFGCRELVYAGSIPRSGVDQMKLDGSEIDCAVHLQHTDFAFESVVEEMGKYVAVFEGDGVKLRFQIKFTGYVLTVADLIEHVRVDPLEVVLKPAQQPLDLQEDPEPIDDSERLISPEQAADTAAEDANMVPGPALASAREAVGGTHQRGRRGAKAAKPEPEPEAEEGDFVKELIQ